MYAAGPIKEYLELFQGPGVNPQLRLAAHAYLHIAFDLPRVISTTLPPQGANRVSMRRAFLRPGPVFLEAFRAHARSGKLGRLAKFLGRFEVTRALGYWVLTLRTVAWVQAELLQ